MPLITICQPQIVLNSLLVNFSTLSARKTARSAFPSVLLRLLSVFLAVDDQLQPSDKGRDRIEKYLPSNYFVRSNQMLSPITIYGTSSVLVIIGRKNMPFPPSYSASMLSLSRMVPATDSKFITFPVRSTASKSHWPTSILLFSLSPAYTPVPASHWPRNSVGVMPVHFLKIRLK